MATAAASLRAGPKPGLVFFHSGVSGACRRAEGFLAQVLQRRRNHETFTLYRVAPYRLSTSRMPLLAPAESTLAVNCPVL